MSTQVKASYLFLAFIPHFVFYLLIQYFITTSQYDFLTELDAIVPFVPSFIWIYHTLLPVIFLTGLLLFKKKNVFLGFVTANIFAGVVLCLFYILFPSFYPREMFVDTATVSGWLIEFTRTIDGAHNTFPSGHVTFAWLLVFFANLSQYVKNHRWIRISYFCWAALISISTLTLKQHYIVDVVSGLVLATAIFYGFKILPLFQAPRNLITIDAKSIPPRTATTEVSIDCSRHIKRELC